MKSKKKRAEVPLEKLAKEAFKVAVAEAIAEHKRNGHPIAVWRNGKVVIVPLTKLWCLKFMQNTLLLAKRGNSL